MTPRDRSGRAGGVAMAAILPALVFLVLPATLYLGNIAEFATPPLALVRLLAGPATLASAVLLLVIRMTPLSRQGPLVTILAAVTLLAWVQAFLFTWDYGPLDGRAIDWHTPPWRGLVDGAAWIAGLVTAGLLHRRIEKPLVMAAAAAFAMQLAVLAASAVGQRQALHEKTRRSAVNDPAPMARFSSERNVLQIVLDSFQADVFHALLNEPGSPLPKVLTGFTFFEEHLGTFPATYLAMPVIVSGRSYRNHMPKADFMASAYGGQSVLTAARAAGYEVDIASSVPLFLDLLTKARHDHAYHIHRPPALLEAARLLDLGLFRTAPHALKPAIYNEQRWLARRLFEPSPAAAFPYFQENAFLTYVTQHLTADRSAPVYKFIHVMTTHAPFVVTPGCGFAGRVVPRDRPNVTAQSRCGLAHVLALFDRMKAAGIYDNTLIVLMGDHGGHVPPVRYAPGSIEQGETAYFLPPDLVALATPLLAIKPMGATAPLRTSRAFTSMSDVAATVDILAGLQGGLPGRSVFAATEDPTVPRRFYAQLWSASDPLSEYIGRIDEVTVTGSAYDVRSWHVGSSFLPPHP